MSDISVYMHTNVLTGKSYVGITKNLRVRWNSHRCIARAKNDSERSHFQWAIRKWGENCWVHSVLEICKTEEAAFSAEKRWIAELETSRTGYNVQEGGRGTLKRTESMRLLVRLSRLGKKATPEARARMSASRKGIKASLEHRQKISKGHLGKPKSEAHRRALSESVKRTMTPEHRATLSEAAKRRPPMSLETRKKLVEVNTGRKHSEDTRKKQRESSNRRFADPEQRRILSRNKFEYWQKRQHQGQLSLFEENSP